VSAEAVASVPTTRGASRILENAAYRQDSAATDLDGLKLATIAYLASNAVNIVGAVLAILVVSRTTARQEQRARYLTLWR
jgi:hypothetical protein